MSQATATVAHLTIATRDVPATAAFFERVFRWSPINPPSNSPIEVCWMDIGRGQQLHILRCELFETSDFEREFGRHFAFFVPSLDIEPFKQRLQAEGVGIIPPERPTPFQRFFFKDPNGYMFEIIDADAWQTES